MRTGFLGLVLLVLIFTVFMAAPAIALDHPWDGTKIVDTLSTGDRTGSNPENNGDQEEDNNSGDGFLGVFGNWLNWIIGSEKQDAELEIQKDNRADARESFNVNELSRSKKY